MIDLERRFLPFDEMEIRAIAGENGVKKIGGYAALFNKRSVEMFGFVEVINPGAFAKSLKGSDVRALRNHDPDYVIGRQKAGTLRVEEDERGLKFEVDTPDTQWARDLLVSIERRDISDMSFAFLRGTVVDKWEMDKKIAVRTIVEAELVEVSPVTFPAYKGTSVALRSMEDLAREGLERIAKEQPGANVDFLRRRLDLRARA